MSSSKNHLSGRNNRAAISVDGAQATAARWKTFRPAKVRPSRHSDSGCTELEHQARTWRTLCTCSDCGAWFR